VVSLTSDRPYIFASMSGMLDLSRDENAMICDSCDKTAEECKATVVGNVGNHVGNVGNGVGYLVVVDAKLEQVVSIDNITTIFFAFDKFVTSCNAA